MFTIKDFILQAAMGYGAEIWELNPSEGMFEIHCIKDRDIFQIKQNLKNISAVKAFDIYEEPNYLDIDFATQRPKTEFSIRGTFVR
jgi:hypothetical protein